MAQTERERQLAMEWNLEHLSREQWQHQAIALENRVRALRKDLDRIGWAKERTVADDKDATASDSTFQVLQAWARDALTKDDKGDGGWNALFGEMGEALEKLGEHLGEAAESDRFGWLTLARKEFRNALKRYNRLRVWNGVGRD